MISDRVWCVTKQLDQLALLCEQHKKQYQHFNGAPDWKSPTSIPAGVSTGEKVTAPSFFAWDSTSKTSKSLAPEKEAIQTDLTDKETTLSQKSISLSILEQEEMKTKSEKLRTEMQQILAELKKKDQLKATAAENNQTQPPAARSPAKDHDRDEAASVVSSTRSSRVAQRTLSSTLKKKRPSTAQSVKSTTVAPVAPTATSNVAPLPVDPRFCSEYMYSFRWPKEKGPEVATVTVYTKAEKVPPAHHLVISGDDALAVAKKSAKEFLHAAPAPAQPPAAAEVPVKEVAAATPSVLTVEPPASTVDIPLIEENVTTSKALTPRHMTEVQSRPCSPGALSTTSSKVSKTSKVSKKSISEPKSVAFDTQSLISSRMSTTRKEPVTSSTAVTGIMKGKKKKKQPSGPESERLKLLQEFNPILMYQRYPPAPRQFPRSTYSAAYGRKQKTRQPLATIAVL